MNMVIIGSRREWNVYVACRGNRHGGAVFGVNKCYIDFDTEELLDRRGLEGFLTEKDFLELYKDVGFQERGGYPYATVKIETFKVLKKLCDSCPLGMKMVLEHGMEKYCPLENQFSLGTVFQLKYPITRTDCPLCGKEVSHFYTDKNLQQLFLLMCGIVADQQNWRFCDRKASAHFVSRDSLRKRFRMFK